jgi:hypothetical protein
LGVRGLEVNAGRKGEGFEGVRRLEVKAGRKGEELLGVKGRFQGFFRKLRGWG